MKKLRNMQAWADDENLISYSTATAWKRGKWCIIRDYPTITSKKHLRAWLDEYHPYGFFRDSVIGVLQEARKGKYEWLILCKGDDCYDVTLYYSREIMTDSPEWAKLLQEYTPTI